MIPSDSISELYYNGNHLIGIVVYIIMSVILISGKIIEVIMNGISTARLWIPTGRVTHGWGDLVSTTIQR